jgi:iron complex transport system substrate-binding protein
MRFFLIGILWCFFLLSCSNRPERVGLQELTPIEFELEIDYAKGFSVEYFEEGQLIHVSGAWKGMEGAKHFWLPSKQGGIQVDDAVNIPANPQRILCMSTTHLYALEWLDEADRVVGVSGAKNVYSEVYSKGIEEKKIADLGSMNDPNYEQILALNPDLVVVYGIGEEVLPILNKFEDLGIPYLLNGEYMEASPLAQAEWIKLFGVLCNKNQIADSLFTFVEDAYLQIQSSASKGAYTPKVLVNAPWEGVWYLPNSSSFAVKFINDAGGRFAIDDDGSSTWRMLDAEAVFEKANDADIWLNTGNHFTLNDLEESFPLAMEFEAFKNGKVFNNLNRVNEHGGNDYWESGIYRPDLLLTDLV